MLVLWLLLGLVAADNWAVVLSASKFYFNYRHTGNAVMIYNSLKRLGYDDDHIIFMLPENSACHSRNNFPGQIYNGQSKVDHYASNLQIDYRGAEVTPDLIMQVLTDRLPKETPAHKRLRSGSTDKVLLFMNGHGGDGYLKIQDTRVLRSIDLALAVKEMHLKGRFGELLIVLDTCQAFTLFNYIDTPAVHVLGSSLLGQMAKSIGFDNQLGISMSDHFSYYFFKFLADNAKPKLLAADLQSVLDVLSPSVIKATYGYRSDKSAKDVKLRTFFSKKLSQGYHSTLEVSYTDAPSLQRHRPHGQTCTVQQQFPRDVPRDVSGGVEGYCLATALSVLASALLYFNRSCVLCKRGCL
jgi:phosphatidylinositol glycan class K